MRRTLLVVATGGTISSVSSGVGFIPGKTAHELTSELTLPKGWILEVLDLGRVLSSNFTLDDLNNVVETVVHSTADAVVVLHGTGVMEETAFLTDVRLAAGDIKKPVVFTGAQRVASEPGADGLHNLLDAVRVATHPYAWRLGAVIVFNGFVLSASAARKTDSWSLHAFTGGDQGALARVNPEGVHFMNWPAWRYPCPGSKLSYDVELIWFSAGMDGDRVRLENVRGVVLAASGVGNVNESVARRIEDAVSRDIAVVVTTRTGAGGVFPWYGGAGGSRTLQEKGVTFTNLDPLKARLLLMAALGNGTSVQDAFRGRLWGPAKP